MAQIASLVEFISTHTLAQVRSSCSGQPQSPIPVLLSPSTCQGSRAPRQQEVRSRGLCPSVLSTLSARAGQGCPRHRQEPGSSSPVLLWAAAWLLREQLGLSSCPGSPCARTTSLPPDMPLLHPAENAAASVLPGTAVSYAGEAGGGPHPLLHLQEPEDLRGGCTSSLPPAQIHPGAEK